jgi:hypothetical protein
MRGDSNGTLILTLSIERLCRNDENAAFVILNEVKNLMDSIRYTTQILRLPPQNDIATQSPTGEDTKLRILFVFDIELNPNYCSQTNFTQR